MKFQYLLDTVLDVLGTPDEIVEATGDFFAKSMVNIEEDLGSKSQPDGYLILFGNFAHAARYLILRWNTSRSQTENTNVWEDFQKNDFVLTEFIS